MKVLISTGTKNIPLDISNQLSEYAKVEYTGHPYHGKLGDVGAVLVGTEQVDSEYLDQAPHLKLVARFGVGYDSVDVGECTRRGVMVTHTPDVLSSGVADHTWALILGYNRHIPLADTYAKMKWGRGEGGFPFGWDTEGKTLGILGLGRIGSEVLKRASGFPVKHLYHDVVRKTGLEQEYGVEYVEFDELLARSDILTIHVDLNPSTRGLMDSEALGKMKPTAHIVNTSRGSVIDEGALYNALKKGEIAGAALDVFETEPSPASNPLFTLPNVLATPHCASATWETRRKMANRSVGNVLAYLRGEIPPHIVPEQKDLDFPLFTG